MDCPRPNPGEGRFGKQLRRGARAGGRRFLEWESLRKPQVAEELYVRVADRAPGLGGRVAGMLLEALPPGELEALLHCDDTLEMYMGRARQELGAGDAQLSKEEIEEMIWPEAEGLCGDRTDEVMEWIDTFEAAELVGLPGNPELIMECVQDALEELQKRAAAVVAGRDASVPPERAEAGPIVPETQEAEPEE